MAHRLSRRGFLAGTLAGCSLTSLGLASGSVRDEETTGFFVVGDTHFLADKDEPSTLDARSETVTARLVDVLNSLPGTEIPDSAGGGRVRPARGVIHAGDCIDTGDKANQAMQRTEWAAFADTFGLSGSDGHLKMPVYEVHGNHDSPRGDGLAVEKIRLRNTHRPGVTNVSESGIHYSWDWGEAHFVNLGIVVGQSEDVARRRRYAPLGSLDFLETDLRENVGSSGRPVVLTHHVDVLRYARPLPVEDRLAMGLEWDPVDVRAYHQALANYRVAAIFYGHTHARNVFHWDGSNRAARQGIPTFNVDNSSHFGGLKQAFFYVELQGDAVTVREYQTSDFWESGTWTPQTWSASVWEPTAVDCG